MVIGEHDVFFHHNYLEPLLRDLNNTNGLAILQSPFLGWDQMSKLKPEIKRSIDRGVRVSLFILQPNPKFKQDPVKIATTNEWAARLMDIGVRVNYRQLIHEKLALFDEFASWEGSLNFMSHVDTKERMNRWRCLAKRQEIIASHQLDTCESSLRSSGFCKSQLPPDSSTLVTPEELRKRQVREQQVQLGQTIARRRENFRLTQAQVAQSAGLRQADISNIESGRGKPSLEKILCVCWALQMGVRGLPLFLLPATDESANLLDKRLVTPNTRFCACGCGASWEAKEAPPASAPNKILAGGRQNPPPKSAGDLRSNQTTTTPNSTDAQKRIGSR